MIKTHSDIVPLGTPFGELTRAYRTIFARRLEHLSVNRYFYAPVIIEGHRRDLSQTTSVDAVYLGKASVAINKETLQTTLLKK